MSSPSPLSACMFECGAPVPPELAAERLCVFHFILSVEQSCADMRREAVTGKLSAERRAHIARGLGVYAVALASVGTGTQRLSDELKKRMLSTFLTLMIMRENLCRNDESEVARYSPRGRSRTA
jgi:hypothetical protein